MAAEDPFRVNEHWGGCPLTSFMNGFDDDGAALGPAPGERSGGLVSGGAPIGFATGVFFDALFRFLAMFLRRGAQDGRTR